MKYKLQGLMFGILLTCGALMGANFDELAHQLVTASNRADFITTKKILTSGQLDVQKMDSNAKDKLLNILIMSGDPTMVDILLRAGANPNIGWGVSLPLVKAASASLSQPSVKETKRVPIENYHEIVRLLLSKGANPNAANSNGTAPLHSAALSGDKKIVEMLIAAGANPYIKDELGRTAHSIAQTRGNTDIINFLKLTHESKD